MSYLKAEQVLPKELIETIQHYIDGTIIYIPSVEKKTWGSNTTTRNELRVRNSEIFNRYLGGESTQRLAMEFSLSVKSIQRIIRESKCSA